MRDRFSPNLALISLGSNIHAIQNLQAAVRELQNGENVQRVSRVWESPPAGFHDQPNFLNAAVLLETPFSAAELKQNLLRRIELHLHRQRDPDNINGPRTIDLDLSIFITPEKAEVFEADIRTRAFVAMPLAELAPDFVLPETGRTLAEIAAGFDLQQSGLIVRDDCNLAALIQPQL